jgi:hypothetical protein
VWEREVEGVSLGSRGVGEVEETEVGMLPGEDE